MTYTNYSSVCKPLTMSDITDKYPLLLLAIISMPECYNANGLCIYLSTIPYSDNPEFTYKSCNHAFSWCQKVLVDLFEDGHKC